MKTILTGLLQLALLGVLISLVPTLKGREPLPDLSKRLAPKNLKRALPRIRVPNLLKELLPAKRAADKKVAKQKPKFDAAMVKSDTTTKAVDDTTRAAVAAKKAADQATKKATELNRIAIDAKKVAFDITKAAADSKKASNAAAKAKLTADMLAVDTAKAAVDTRKAADKAAKKATDTARLAADAKLAADMLAADTAKAAADTRKAADKAAKKATDADKLATNAKTVAAKASKTLIDAQSAAKAAEATQPAKEAKAAEAAGKAAKAAAKAAEDAKAARRKAAEALVAAAIVEANADRKLTEIVRAAIPPAVLVPLPALAAPSATTGRSPVLDELRQMYRQAGIAMPPMTLRGIHRASLGEQPGRGILPAVPATIRPAKHTLDESDLGPFSGTRLGKAAVETPDLTRIQKIIAREVLEQRIAARGHRAGFKGFCPVALRDKHELVDALSEYNVTHNGRIYLFSSAKSRDAFLASPESYIPAAYGRDVVLKSRRSNAVGSIDHALWYRGRLYLFAGPDTLAIFNANPSLYASATRR